MVEYCEILKMALPKILDFRRGLKIRPKAPERYNKWLEKSKLLLGAIFCYPILNLADSLGWPQNSPKSLRKRHFHVNFYCSRNFGILSFHREFFESKMPLSKAFKAITKFVPYISHEKSIRESGVIMGWIYVYIWHASKIGQKITYVFQQYLPKISN